jgi:hypothetical protein
MIPCHFIYQKTFSFSENETKSYLILLFNESISVERYTLKHFNSIRFQQEVLIYIIDLYTCSFVCYLKENKH